MLAAFELATRFTHLLKPRRFRMRTLHQRGQTLCLEMTLEISPHGIERGDIRIRRVHRHGDLDTTHLVYGAGTAKLLILQKYPRLHS